MSFNTAPIMTNAGIALHARAVGGETLTFTSLAIGSAELEGAEIAELTELINEEFRVGIMTINAGANYATVKGRFDNSDITEAFYYREIGIYAADPDYPDDREHDILYCYANAENAADIIQPASVAAIVRQITIPIVISNVSEVTAIISGSSSYNDLEDRPTINEEVVAGDMTSEDLHLSPEYHASTLTKYGISTASLYGHAKAGSVTPQPLGNASAGTANGIYANENHVHQKPSLDDLGAAPKYHASASTDYGKGTASLHGHVKLSDSPSASLDATYGTAATPKAVETVRALAVGKATTVTYTIQTGTTWNATSGSAPYTQTIGVSGILASDNPIVGLIAPTVYADVDAAQDEFAEIYRITTAANSITLYAHSAVSVALDLQLKVVR